MWAGVAARSGAWPALQGGVDAQQWRLLHQQLAQYTRAQAALQCALPHSVQVPDAIKRSDGMPLGKYHEGLSESEFLQMFKEMAGKNKVRGNVGCGC